MTVTSIFSSFLQLVFGATADKYRNRKAIISLALLARSVACLLLMVSKDVVSMALWYIVASLFLSGFMPLAQSIVADLSEKGKLGVSMGRYRLFGSIGWAVSCILTGFLARENLWSIFPITLAFSTSSFLISLALPEVERFKESSESMQSTVNAYIALAACFAISIFLSGVSMGATSSFLTISLNQLGSDPFFIGVIIALGAFLEVPAMYLGGRLSDLIGSIPVLVIGEAGLGVIYWLYGNIRNIFNYLLIQGARGVLYALFTVSGMSISSRLGGSKKGGFYAGLYNLSLYLGMASGPYIGGLVSDYQGLWAMFALSSVLAGISAILLFPWMLSKSKEK
jgi:PPP family 3-phenylpropionic acid transporter